MENVNKINLMDSFRLLSDYIVEGILFEIEGEESFTMNEGDIFIVGKGINHRVSSTEKCKIMLVENKSTAHTGEIITEITKGIDEQSKID